MSKYLLFPLTVLLFSCAKDDPVIPNEEELITTLEYILTPVDGGNDVIFRFSDPDGDGGMTPQVISPSLERNTLYNGRVLLLNESLTPPEIISEEVSQEAVDHQMFYTISGLDSMQIEYADTDANGHPVGLLTMVSSGDAGTGSLTITLRHQPDKSASGVEEGLLENAGGETDIEVTFPVNVQ